MVIGKYH